MSDPKSARSNDPIVCLHEILDGIGEINRWRRDVDEWRKKVDDRLDEGNREFQRQSADIGLAMNAIQRACTLLGANAHATELSSRIDERFHPAGDGAWEEKTKPGVDRASLLPEQ